MVENLNAQIDETVVKELEDLLLVLAQALVEKPEEVKISSRVEEDTVTLEVRVDDEDMGRVIGRGGKRAQAIRSIMKAKASRSGCRAMVDIVD